MTAIVPVYNKRDFVAACANALIAAARAMPSADVVFVDHSSTDGSGDLVRKLASEVPALASVVTQVGGTISAVRNTGARAARGALLCFIDSDVVVAPDFFAAVARVGASTDAGAFGCEYDVPAQSHWSERVWDDLHNPRSDGYRHYLNGGDLIVRRPVFDQIGGWGEHLAVGEDTEICTRIRRAGHRIFESRALAAIHLGNPKSLGAFFRKQRWHGASTFDDASLRGMNKATLMLYAFIVSCTLAIATPFVSAVPWSLRVVGMLALVLAVPTVTVLYRFLEVRRLTSVPGALLLYVLYYSARATALADWVRKRMRRA